MDTEITDDEMIATLDRTSKQLGDILATTAPNKVESLRRELAHTQQAYLAMADTADKWMQTASYNRTLFEQAQAARVAAEQVLASAQKETQSWRKHAIDMQNAAERYDAKCQAAEAALAEYKTDTPWESMWMYFSHGDYGPDAWHEVDEWLRTNMPREMARTWLGMPEVQP